MSFAFLRHYSLTLIQHRNYAERESRLYFLALRRVGGYNCMRERRSFSALCGLGISLHRVLWHFLFLHGNFMGPLAINSAPRIFSDFFPGPSVRPPLQLCLDYILLLLTLS